MRTSIYFLLKNKSILFFKSFEPKTEQLKYSYLLICASLLFSFSATSQTNISGVINDYQSVSGITFPGCGPCDTSAACLNAITVGNASAFSIGDRVLIIQMKGATIDNTNIPTAGNVTDIGNAGNYEFFTISNIIGNDVYPNGPLVNAYDVPGLVQLVRVPNFDANVNVNGLVSGTPWDPVLGVGGVVAIFVEDTLTLNADIDAGEMGYNGVTVSANGTLDSCFGVDPDTYMVLPSTNTESSPKGQGIVVDDPNFNRGRAPRANGGGGGMAGDSGGGGGSNYGAGGIGGKRWCDTNPGGADAGGEGGYSLLTYLAQRRVFLGGAGGAGYITNLNSAIATNGGGIVVIRARHIVGNGHTILAQGADSAATGTGIDGGGGGGGGGSVAFDIESYSGTVNVDISGGDGQDLGTTVLHGPGGGGGGGVFLHNLSAAPANIIIDLQGGIAGVHQAPQNTNTNGAQDGAIGGIISYYTIVETPDGDDDGIANFCDLDSDGDGILDTEEAGGSTFDPSKDSDGDGIDNYLDGSDVTPGFPAFNDANGDGVNDLYDNDDDGVPDFLDLDSDNDGIYDVIEAGGVDGDGDGLIGTGALVDTNNNGWSDIADSTNGGTPLILIQSDADSIPDLLDVDSDGDGCYDAIEGSGSFVAGDLTSSNNLADNDEGSVDSNGVPTNTGSPQGTNSFVTTASAMGTITTQPTASSICLGSNATFTVVDTGDDLVYQWQERIGVGAWTSLSKETRRNPPNINSTRGFNSRGMYWNKQNRGYSINTDLLLNYKKKDLLIKGFDIDVNTGFSMYKYEDQELFASTRGGIVVPGIYSLNNSVERPDADAWTRRKQVNSWLGIASLSYADAVFLDVTGRNDWSSTLATTENSYFYPSAAGSILISKWLKPSWLDLWKVRGSWTLSKKDLGVYETNVNYDVNVGTWGEGYSEASYTSTIKNAVVKPEVNRTWEIGTAAYFFKNRLNLDVAYYQSLNYDRQRSATISSASGFTSTLVNIDETIERRGLEISVNADIIRKEDFTWSVSANWAKSHRYLKELDPIYSADNLWTYAGARLDTYRIRPWLRDPQGNLIHDAGGRTIRSNFEEVIGYSDPDFIWGLTNTITWKNFNFHLSFDGRVGGLSNNRTNEKMWDTGSHPDSDNEWRYDEVVNGNTSYIGEGVKLVSGTATYDQYGNITADDRTYATNDIPISYQVYARRFGGGSFGATNPTYLKLREIAIGYSMPKKITEKIGLDSATIALTAQNVLLWTKEYRFADPDWNSDSDLTSPSQRFVGLNITLSTSTNNKNSKR
ncbi:hypothetical protein [Flavivirga spongiicola]|uniref:Uncharacterized protein n=1 Tax=Flavivirga spongiicola TaxID=421621 RepID=A0ABU7XWL0_9FLAO|nr:hypothetical protein [Flavivirga sp. MEBiC05379]MDO5980159.1 hypothetical protein [Flavivirga sp. MEBiC05379]